MPGVPFSSYQAQRIEVIVRGCGSRAVRAIYFFFLVAFFLAFFLAVFFLAAFFGAFFLAAFFLATSRPPN
jgi:hypothetical protein